MSFLSGWKNSLFNVGPSRLELAGGRVALKDNCLQDAWLDYLWRSDEEIAQLDACRPLKMTFDDYLRVFKDQLRRPSSLSRRLSIASSLDSSLNRSILLFLCFFFLFKLFFNLFSIINILFSVPIRMFFCSLK